MKVQYWFVIKNIGICRKLGTWSSIEDELCVEDAKEFEGMMKDANTSTSHRQKSKFSSHITIASAVPTKFR